MKLGRVRGPVWGARHAEGLDGAKLLLVEPLEAVRVLRQAHDERGEVLRQAQDERGEDRLVGSGGELVAVDALGAGPGDLVLVAHGSRVRDLTVGERVPDKDVIVAIVDDASLARGAR